jgi:hypothetical protein
MCIYIYLSGGSDMQYLAQMRLNGTARPATAQEGVAFIEDSILPTLERCQQYVAQGKILAGGPVSGTIALSLVIRADSIQEVDELVMSLAVWPLMETTITPLTTFEGRMLSVRSRLSDLKAQSSAAGELSAV